MPAPSALQRSQIICNSPFIGNSTDILCLHWEFGAEFSLEKVGTIDRKPERLYQLSPQMVLVSLVYNITELPEVEEYEI